jgi:glycosyltransferase involved in cell wall biosynthesis
MLSKLKSAAKSNIKFLGQASDEQVRELYRSCRAFVFPGEEDFGITPVEAMACGRPVIAYAGGGLLETVVPGDPERGTVGTGIFFDKPDPESLAAAVRRFDPEIYDPSAIAAHARKFDTSVFKDRLRWFIKEAYEEYQKNGPEVFS